MSTLAQKIRVFVSNNLLKPTSKATEILILDIHPKDLIEIAGGDENITIKFKEYSHLIDVSAINHIYKKHGNMAKELEMDQVAVTIADYELIPDIIRNPDEVSVSKNKRNLLLLVYRKKIDNVYYYVEEIREGKKMLALVTMYIKKSPA